MNHRKILGILLGLSLVGLAVSLMFFPGSYSFCHALQNCSDSYPLIMGVGHPLFFGLIPFAFILFILFLFPKDVFNTWKKFAIVLIPILIVLIIITPIQCSAPLGMCFDRILTTRFTSIGFAILSLIIIIYKSVRILLAKKKVKQV